MARALKPWVFCRECVHFKPYAYALDERGLGYCGAEPRRHRLDRDRKRHCADYEAARL